MEKTAGELMGKLPECYYWKREYDVLKARVSELETLVDGAKPIIELWKDKCDYSWREDWLAKARGLLAGGIPIKPEDVDL